MGRTSTRIGLPVALVVLLAALALLPAAASADSTHQGAPAPRDKFGRGTSTNWSGYAATGTEATHVIGSWIQPAPTCASRESSWSSPWVGIDGFNSSTVEQIGTDTDCSTGQPSYYAWYEMYPKRLVQINIPVAAGNSFTGEVTYVPGSSSFVLKLTNNTTHTTFQTTQAGKKLKRSSLEWVMEGPSNGLLTNFGTVGFTASSGTINGQTGNLGSFATVQPITMVSSAGATRAEPTAIGSDAASFGVNWVHG